MKSSKSDKFIYGIWLKLLILYFIMFILSAVVPIAAMFPNLGFPCYFNNLVNYGSMDLRERNVFEHITPTLFLEGPEMMSYISYSFLVDCCSMLYYAIGCAAVICHRKSHVQGLTTLSNWVHMVGSPGLIYMGFLRLWTIQLFIHTLSYKHIYLAAFVYAAHFLLSFIHIQSYISRNSAVWTIEAMKQHIPAGTLLDKVLTIMKPITINLHLSCLALEMLVFSLSFMMAVGNSFYVLVSDIVFGAINIFLVLTIIWYGFTEFFLVRYEPRQFGFYAGVISASIILLLPVIRYDHIFVRANMHRAVVINISIIPILATLATLVRIIRLFKKGSKPSYIPIKIEKKVIRKEPEETLFMRTTSTTLLTDEETDSEDDI